MNLSKAARTIPLEVGEYARIWPHVRLREEHVNPMPAGNDLGAKS